jgi:hypothetical protein
LPGNQALASEPREDVVFIRPFPERWFGEKNVVEALGHFAAYSLMYGSIKIDLHWVFNQ